MHVGAIHDIQGPQLWVFHIEILDCDIAHIPENEGHWSTRLGEILLSVVPDVPIAVDTASSIPIDPNAVTSDDEAGMMILKSYRI